MPKKKSKSKKKKPKVLYPRINNPKPDVAEECEEYRKEISEFACEAETYLRRHPPADAWIQKQIEANYGMHMRTEVHHLFGRGVVAERHWFCSLIQLGAITHKYAHDQNSHQVEVCCLFSKLGRHKRYLELSQWGIKPVEPESRLVWHPEAMAKASSNDSLAGRIEGILMPCDSVKGTIFYQMCETMLRHLERENAS